MDTAIMAVRVALLLLITGMFAALWSGDSPDQMASVDRPPSILVGKREVAPQRNPQRPLLSQNENKLLAVRLSPLSNAHQRATPLPQEIAAGTYLVADQFGRTEIRVVSLHESFPNAESPGNEAKDHYKVEIGNARWHYIRLNQNLPDRMAVQHSFDKPF